MITLEEGLNKTWRLPVFSALLMEFKASAKTDERVIFYLAMSLNVSIELLYFLALTSYGKKKIPGWVYTFHFLPASIISKTVQNRKYPKDLGVMILRISSPFNWVSSSMTARTVTWRRNTERWTCGYNCVKKVSKTRTPVTIPKFDRTCRYLLLSILSTFFKKERVDPKKGRLYFGVQLLWFFSNPCLLA